MSQRKRHAGLFLAVLAFGALRMPVEQKITHELTDADLLPLKLEQNTGEKIGQTFSAVSLGGLRTLVATFLNLRAFGFFTEQRWADVNDTYDLIVDLAPRTRYYWDTASWHQAYNAAAFYLYESDMAPLRRKANWRASILLGSEILQRAIRNNPNDPILKHRLGTLYSDTNKISAFGEPHKAYEAAYEAYASAANTAYAPEYTKRFALYSLARVPGREKDALNLLREVEKLRLVKPPTLLAISYSLEYFDNPNQPIDELIDSHFTTRKQAYDTLGNFWSRTREHFQMHGIAQAIAFLESDLKIPENQSIFKKPILPPLNVDEFFGLKGN